MKFDAANFLLEQAQEIKEDARRIRDSARAVAIAEERVIALTESEFDAKLQRAVDKAMARAVALLKIPPPHISNPGTGFGTFDDAETEPSRDAA